MQRVTRATLVPLLCLILLVALPAIRSASVHVYAAREPRGVVNGLLRAEIDRIRAQHAGTLKNRQALPRIPVVITSDRDVADAVRARGGHVDADIGGTVMAATLPADAVTSIAATQGVRTVFPSLQHHLLLDRSVPEIRANQVWGTTDRQGLPVTGRGVLIGLVDTGIDYSNPDFSNPDGTTRIVSIWDQTGQGHPPDGFSYGDECDTASIQAGTCAERDTDGHGTHVAGTAAGNGRSGGSPPEIGVAPEAQLIVVKSNLTLSHILAAWKYLTDRATALGKPIVINDSFGSQIAPHDGTSPEDLAIDRLSGPGRIFVAAAGNEGNGALHTSGVLTPGADTSVTVSAADRRDEVNVGIFYPRSATLSFTVSALGSGESFEIRDGESLDNREIANGTLRLDVESDSWDANWSILYVGIKSPKAEVNGQFRVDLHPLSLAAPAPYNAWIDDDSSASFANPDESDTVGAPADARSAIAVGNYATRTSWIDRDGHTRSVCAYFRCTGGELQDGDISAYSSLGPTLDGRQKPDISAPGTMIESTLSHDAAVCGPSTGSDCISPAEISQDGLHLFLTGTSMSCPHVVGTVALMLQVNPSLGAGDVDTILRATARHDSFTGPGWGPAFGAGKVDALAAVNEARNRPIVTATPLPTATPESTSTALPTATATPSPTAVPAAVSIVGIRIDRHGSSDGWRALGVTARVKAEIGVDLSVYTRFSNLTIDTPVAVRWQVYRGATSVLDVTRRYMRGRLEGGIAWDHTRFVPGKTGSYTYVARVQMSDQQVSRSVRFVAVS